MATVFSIVVALVLLAGSSLGVRRVHEIFPKPGWLPVVLAVFFALPVVLAALKLKDGRSGVRAFLRTLFATAAGVVVMTVVYQRWTTNWIWVCLAGVVAAGVIGMIQASQMMQAQLNLNQGLEAFNANRFQDALKHAQLALDIAVARGERAVCAEAEFLAGLCYNQMGESVRAARYLNRSRADFGPKGPKPRLEQIRQVLGQLRIAGVDTPASAAPAADEGRAEGLAGQVAINTLLSTGAILACLKLWGLQGLQWSLPVLLLCGAVVVLLVAGGYFTADLVLARGQRRSIMLLLPLQSLALLVAAAGVFGLLVRRGFVAVSGVSSLVRPLFPDALTVAQGWPAWAFPALAAGGGLGIFLVLMAATGRSPLGVFKGVARGSSDEKSLRLARAHLDAGEWSKAIIQLSRIDLVNEKDAQQRADTLFLLAYAHHKAGHPNEAVEHVGEMLEVVPDSREGLYLAGYLALSAGQLEPAESHWRRLHSLSPGYCPADQRKGNRSATFYLCLTLYRKAMGLVGQDVEEGARVLGEVGRLGALDREAADALVRVHLHRFVEFVRRNDWTKAEQEAELAQGKLEALQKTEVDPSDMAKIHGFALSAQGLTAFHHERHREAARCFASALEATKALRPAGSFVGGGATLLEQMLRAMIEGQSDARSIHPSFPRDCGLLAAVAELHALRDEGLRGTELSAALASVQTPLNAGLAASPDSPEILALLGLLWYHLGADDDMQEKGIEALQRIRDRVASRFVSQTLAGYASDREVLQDARQAYFDLLRQHLQSADVPLPAREALHAEVIEKLRERGQYEAFLGKGGLDVNAAEEPSVREYVNRAHLLDAKVKQALMTKRAAGVSPQVAELIDRLNAQNQSLQQTIGSIADLEKKILHEALELM